VKISEILISEHRIALDPPFPPAWDGRPRAAFGATLVRVRTDAGLEGIGSGDAMHGFGEYVDLFLGEDPADLPRHHAILENIDFHAGRPWPLDCALWDLRGKAEGRPVHELLGSSSRSLRAYASTGVLRDPDAEAEQARALVARGFRALKLRFGRASLERDFEALAAVRDSVGSDVEIMVDVNQGWRMPWDTQPAWTVDDALPVAKGLAEYDVSWIEEPLHRGDYQGHARLRRESPVRLAGGELTREPYEFGELLAHECLDVYQPDAVLTRGITGLSRLAREVEDRGLVFTPHTWGNGIGLLANAHLAATTRERILEFPYDPPEWPLEARDFMLRAPIEIDDEGSIQLSADPGLGITLCEETLARTRTRETVYAGGSVREHEEAGRGQ
jgi:L-alanine-DL-glutamate epimerase-like enolase superfamily enzyme